MGYYDITKDIEGIATDLISKILELRASIQGDVERNYNTEDKSHRHLWR